MSKKHKKKEPYQVCIADRDCNRSSHSSNSRPNTGSKVEEEAQASPPLVAIIAHRKDHEKKNILFTSSIGGYLSSRKRQYSAKYRPSDGGGIWSGGCGQEVAQ